MGQAKNRGSYEARRAQAVERNLAAAIARDQARRKRHAELVGFNEDRKAGHRAIMATLAGLGMSARIIDE